ncbi:50S ribosomal protein L30 [Haploplasma modicum]|jgi:large subunit ribosomal protein L30|uniref:50S ribosomal protein L30 n=1 Tax=Haploplasma modicum TaxID=2150 RepID=UPI00047DC6D0|nr:50S ribosomal protein L30 [Haploplasma modicum]MCR1808620.1 50S ribosomal protein L30 [Haploplasma modicum]
MKVQVTLTRSLIGRKKNQIRTANALGLSKVNQVVVHEKNEAILGMINTIVHLVKVEDL